MTLLTRHEQMRLECEAFHREHPEVWELFDRFALERLARGFRRYSADAIMHRVRWETAVPRRIEGSPKINDHHVAFYARRWLRIHPEHEGFFETRVQKSALEAPRSDPPFELDPN